MDGVPHLAEKTEETLTTSEAEETMEGIRAYVRKEAGLI